MARHAEAAANDEERSAVKRMHPQTILARTMSKTFIERVFELERRMPWLLPALSFSAGWLSFALVQRGEALARVIAALALIGWPWLLIEPWLRRRLERRQQRLGNLVVNFISQSLQQELLFFSLPFLIGATELHAGHIAFTGIAAAAALLSTVDPWYERLVAVRAARRMTFHAYCSWLAALVVLPIALSLPVERALPLSLIGVAAWLLLTLPLSLYSLRGVASKLVWSVSILIAPVLVWMARAELPAAGLAVTEARITQSIEDLSPGPTVRRLDRIDLERGVIAFAAIRAPSGLAQEVVFEWRHADHLERIVEQIQGGRSTGFRTYSRKQIFPEAAAGSWTVDVLTPQQQLLKRLRFVVYD
jgi:hypothetical protein